MAETAGLAVSVVGLAGLFSATIDCFELVRIAKTFDRDFATAQLRLGEASLRLSRWGAMIGISTGGLDRLAENERQRVEKLLNHIRNLFSQAEEKVDIFGDRNAPSYNPESDLSQTQRAVRKGITAKLQKRLDQVRSRGHDLANRTKWAIAKKNDLDSLIEGIIQSVTTLELLLPGPEEESRLALQKEAEIEVTEIHEAAASQTDGAEISKVEVVETLGEAAAGIDPHMEEAVKKIIEALKPELQGSGTTYNVSQKIDRVDQNQGFVSAYSSGNTINYHGR